MEVVQVEKSSPEIFSRSSLLQNNEFDILSISNLQIKRIDTREYSESFLSKCSYTEDSPLNVVLNDYKTFVD